jgi:predicted acylesterase/phospholipase RssA/CRP-like cAMP-binding protein
VAQTVPPAGSEIARQALGTAGIFAGLEGEVLDELLEEMDAVSVAGGEVVIRQGDLGDCMYLVVSGRLNLAIRDAGHETFVAELGPGDLVGEMALLVDSPRTMTVRTIRDSVLLRLSASSFRGFVQRHPQVLLPIAQMLARRLEKTSRPARRSSSVRTIVVVPAGDSMAVAEAARDLVDALRAFGRVDHVDSRRIDDELGPGEAQRLLDAAGADVVTVRLQRYEDGNDHLVYEADPRLTAWTRRCLRQADRVVLVAEAGADNRLGEVEAEVLAPGAREMMARTDLLLLHDAATAIPTGTSSWLAQRPVAAHHHVRRGSANDYARVARLLTGNGVGLVLGGGGPRGFAHLGAMRALEEAGVPIDMVGGTSIGAVMGATYAMGWSHDERVERAVNSFVRSRFLLGLTLPMVSLSSSAKLTRLLRADASFANVQIEDLWTRWFCVSANLSRSEAVIHERGDTWRAIRASISLPGILPPVFENGDLLVDGGVVNNLPVDLMSQRIEGGKIVAVDLQTDVELRVEESFEPSISGWRVFARKVNPFRKSLPIPNIVAVIMRAKEIGSTAAQREVLAGSLIDLYLRPPVEHCAMLDFGAGPELIEIGYRYTAEQLERRGTAGLITQPLTVASLA